MAGGGFAPVCFGRRPDLGSAPPSLARSLALSLAAHSCWAFSSTETLNDRRCIVHDEHELRSPEETNDCAGLIYGSMGCNGGQVRSMQGADG